MAGWKNSVSNQALSRSINERRDARLTDDDTVPFTDGPVVIKKKESSIEAACVAYAVARGWKHKKIGTNAWPDHLFINTKARVIWIEFKRPGEGPRPNQLKRIREIIAMGFDCYVVDRKEQYAHVFGP